MRKLIWQNSLGDEINLTKAPFGITNWEGFSNAPLNIQSQQVPMQDGSVFLDALIENRDLSVTLSIQDGNDLEKRYQLERELIHFLNPKLGEGYLIYTNDFISKKIKCIPQIPLFPNKNSNDPGTQKGELSWTACNPYWEDTEEKEVFFNGYYMPQIENNGDIDVELKIEISPEVETDVRIINGEQELDIADVDKNIVINTAYGNKQANEENVEISALMISPDTKSSLQQLAYLDDCFVFLSYQYLCVYNFLTKKMKYSSAFFGRGFAIYCLKCVNHKVLLTEQSPAGVVSLYEFKPKTMECIKICDFDSSLYVTAIYDISFDGTYYVCTGNTTPKGVLRSQNLTDWELVEISNLDLSAQNRVSVTSIGLFVTDRNHIFKSTDHGETWTIKNTKNGAYYTGVAENDLILVCGGMYPAYSTDHGETWYNGNTTSASSNCGSVDFFQAANSFVYPMQGLTVSDDGINWANKNYNEFDRIFDLLYINDYGVFVLVTDNGFFICNNLRNPIFKKLNDDYDDSANIKNVYVTSQGLCACMGTSKNTLIKKNNTFEEIDIKSNCVLERDGKLIFGVVGGIAILEGVNITNITMPYANAIKAIAYFAPKSVYIAVGSDTLFNGGAIWASTNLSEWSIARIIQGTEGSEGLTDICVHNDECLICGDKGAVVFISATTDLQGFIYTTQNQSLLNKIVYDESKAKFFIFGNGSQIFEQDISWSSGIRINFLEYTIGDSSKNITGGFYSKKYGRIIICYDGELKLFTSRNQIESLQGDIYQYSGGIESDGVIYLYSANYSNVLEEFIFKGENNIISKVTGNMDLKIMKGVNTLQILSSNKQVYGKISYRQKYIGV